MSESAGRESAPGEIVDAVVVVEEPVDGAAATAPSPPPAENQLGGLSPEHVARSGTAVEPFVPRDRSIIQAADPDELLEKAEALASRLTDVIKKKNLYAKIGGKDHVEVGGWGLLGTLLGVFGGPALHPDPVWHRMVLDPETGKPKRTQYHVLAKSYHPKSQGGGLKETRDYDIDGFDWECRVEVKSADGTVFGAAEAMVSRGEDRWAQADDYAVRSMAETRATGRAYRAACGWIVELAGYKATPAEEMPKDNELPAWALEADDARKRRALEQLTALVGGDQALAKGFLVSIKEKIGFTPIVVCQFIGGLHATVADRLRQQPPAPAAAQPAAAATMTEPGVPLQAHVPPDEACECGHPAKHHQDNGACMFQRCPCSGFKTFRAGREPAQQELAEQLDQAAQQAAETLQGPVGDGSDHDFSKPWTAKPPPVSDGPDTEIPPSAPAARNGNGHAPAADIRKVVEYTNMLIEVGYETPDHRGPLGAAVVKLLGYEDPREFSERAVEKAKELVAAAAGGNQGRARIPEEEAVRLINHCRERNPKRVDAINHAVKELRDWIPF